MGMSREVCVDFSASREAILTRLQPEDFNPRPKTQDLSCCAGLSHSVVSNSL